MGEGIKAEPLSADEVRWCDNMRTAAVELCEVYTGTRPSSTPTIRQIHDTYEGWLAATRPRGLFRKTSAGHPDANAVSMSLGVALGDQIARETGLEWMIITDAYGTDLGLFFAGLEGEYSDIVTHPMGFIAKRIAERESDWLEPTAAQLIKDILEMKNGRDG